MADSLLTRIRRHWSWAELAHRLDRDTSGLLLVALDADMHRALSRLFAERGIEKTYVADVAGIPSQSAGSIDLPLAVQNPQTAAPGAGGSGPALPATGTLEEMEKQALIQAQEATGYNHTQAARKLGITRRTLGYRIDKYGLPRHSRDRNQEHGEP